MDILSAIRTIQNASDACLQRYASETISMIRAVSHRLEQNLIPHSSFPNIQPTPFHTESSSPLELPQTTPKGTPAVSVGTPLSPPRSPRGPHHVAPLETPRQQGGVLEFQSPTRSPEEQFENSNTVSSDQAEILAKDVAVPLQVRPEKRPRRPSPDNVLGVLQGILKSIDVVADACQKGQNVLISPKRHIFSDQRLEHIQQVERKARFSTADDILLNTLALRSIASQFTCEQILAKQSIKLNEIYEYAKSGNENDTERDALLERRLFRFDENGFSGTVLREGLKHLVLETLIAERLQENNPTSPITTSSIMVVSALVGFHKDSFRRLRYKEMPNLAVCILSTIIPESGNLLLDFVREHSPWFENVQKRYNMMYMCLPHPADGGSNKSPRYSAQYSKWPIDHPLDTSFLFEDLQYVHENDLFEDPDNFYDGFTAQENLAMWHNNTSNL